LQAEIHFDGRQDTDRLSILAARFKSPRCDSFLRLLVQPESQGTQHRDINQPARFINHDFENDRSLDAGVEGLT